MNWVIFGLMLFWIGYLFSEAAQVRRASRQLTHVIHVNGTRGKSSVCRLIDAGLRAGGLRVFCKTTGTDPMTIDTEGREALLVRRAKPNIKEQISILRRAAMQKAQVLIVECMALQPELQYVSQHRILRADIGVITNVRWDHSDIMGDTLPEICDALCNTIPRDGVLFTGEQKYADRIAAAAKRLGSGFIPVCPAGEEPDIDFPENIALALSVCGYLGVERETALLGMKQFRRDPYSLSLYRIHGAIWINGLSANDPLSTCLIWEKVKKEHGLADKRLILLLTLRNSGSSS